MLKEAYERGWEAALLKVAGGPGSGVSGDNTAPIGLPQSEHVSVGTRKGLLDNMHWVEKEIDVKDISACAQEKYVPEKLKKFLENPEMITGKPIDVLEVDDEGPECAFHILDGHHRALAAMKLGIKTLKARVRKKAKKTYGKDC